MKIRLYNTRILTMEENKPIFRGEVWIKDEVIVRILPQGCPQSSIFSDDESLIKSSDKPQIISGTEFQSISDDEFPIIWDEEIDCQGNLLMPGFKNAHTHSAMTCLRSFADDVPLNTWLTEKIFPIEAKLQPNDIYTLTKLAILEYLSSGITAIFDMYLCTEAVAKACQDT
ncbi:MAG: amidohydrolase family protein, partial [Clostridium sp.]|nr:amidohydrolase family protein [Clostridium sp.]